MGCSLSCVAKMNHCFVAIACRANRTVFALAPRIGSFVA
jgi:hypothetical protein